MTPQEWANFIIRIIAFLVTYYYMVDYLFIVNLNTGLCFGVVIVSIIIISICYWPLRGKNLKVCDLCKQRS